MHKWYRNDKPLGPAPMTQTRIVFGAIFSEAIDSEMKRIKRELQINEKFLLPKQIKTFKNKDDL